MSAVTTILKMDLDGGIACLDFINSGLHDHPEEPAERLHSYQDLLTLVKRLSLMEPGAIRGLSAAAAQHPRKAQEALIKTLQLRQVLHAIFGAIADHKVHHIEEATLKIFNEHAGTALSTRQFVVKGETLQLIDTHAVDDMLRPLHLFILSAYDLLRDGEHRYIRRCGRCQWLFLDTTKNHRRKWCSMRDCGSLEKAGRYYRRKKML